MSSRGNVEEAGWLKWPKHLAYGEELRKTCRRAGLQKKRLGTLSGWSVGQIKRAMAGEHVSLQAHEDIFAALNAALKEKSKPEIQVAYPWPIAAPNRQDLRVAEEKFQGYIRTNLYDEAAQLAEATFKWCSRSKQFVAAGHWADHAAGIYSLKGKLRDALRLLDDCFDALGKTTKSDKSSVEMRLVSLRANFERTMTREYKALGEFRKARNQFKSFDRKVDQLVKLGVPDGYKDWLVVRKTHHKRQQAEMLRLLGNYSAAHQLMDEAIKEYPDWADEARRQGELHKADSLRLLGRTEAALEIYEKLERTAKNRHLDGLLGSVLWTKIGAIQASPKSSEQKRKLKSALTDIQSLVNTDGNQYGYLVIYSKLVSVSSNVADPHLAHQIVNDAVAAGPLEADCFRTEFAHAALCRGEIERGQNNTKQAREFFKQALHFYELMEMRWGIVRSIIGLNKSGERRALPAGLEIEGCDRTLWSDFLTGRFPAIGSLCENIP